MCVMRMLCLSWASIAVVGGSSQLTFDFRPWEMPVHVVSAGTSSLVSRRGLHVAFMFMVGLRAWYALKSSK